jgi:hypothetical protein
MRQLPEIFSIRQAELRRMMETLPTLSRQRNFLFDFISVNDDLNVEANRILSSFHFALHNLFCLLTKELITP